MDHEQVGPYRVVGKLGEGGMGEVYRARDSKLQRDVAIKVLPPALADDPERVGRFEREAQVLASLNHPNIAAIYGFEGGTGGAPRALVMELVEGPTLADLIARAGAPAHGLPVADALAIARQIIDALEAAHERGIIHRDLKPANIKVRDDGTVKVLDFGLAKALDPMGAPGEGDPMNSPTLTARSTQLGVILGTAAYMSPEQAKGRPVDKRADIWAFGAVLYEMLTGRRAFAGEDVSDTLASVLRQDVDWSALPADTPPGARRLLERCLDRDVKRRLRDIGDGRADLDLPAASGVIRSSAPPAGRSRLTGLWPLVAGLVIAAAGLTWGVLRTPPPAAAGVVTRTEIPLPALDIFLRLSRDGTRLTFSRVTGQGHAEIGFRKMNELTSTLVNGAPGGYSIFSPDGQWIAYQSLEQVSKIQKIPATGGTPISLCDGWMSDGADWGEDDTILFEGDGGLRRIAASGGTPEVLTKVDKAKGEVEHSYPQFLPGGQRVLFTVSTQTGAPQFAVLDLGSKTYRTIAPGGGNGRYQPSGHLTYVRGTDLYAVPFDLATLTVTGPEVAVADNVSSGADAKPDYTASANGLLLYSSQAGAQGSTLAWVDRKGAVKALADDLRARWGTGRLSPDGTRVANSMSVDRTDDIWVVDAERGTRTRLTNLGSALFPLWTADGRRIIFMNFAAGHTTFYAVPADSSAAPTALTAVDGYATPVALAPDGHTLLYFAHDQANKVHLMALPLGPGGVTGPPRRWHESTFEDAQADYSPNGQWVAYESNQSGGKDVYVQAASGTGAEVRVSLDGGYAPRWSRNGRELFYWVTGASQRLMVVDVPPGAAFAPSAPHEVVRLLTGTTWDVSPDPNKFLVELTTTTGGSSVVMVTDWFDELRRLVPPKK